MNNPRTAGHGAAAVTIFIWGTTFISTKLLLTDFTPVEILFFRFIMGLIILYLACPRPLRLRDKKQELVFAAAGLSGITLYYLLENIALTFTMASNVGVIISVAPFFTAIWSRIFLKGEERLGIRFLVGFAAAMAGITIISFRGGETLQLNPMGDLLAFGAAFVWSVYSILSKKLSAYGYPVTQTTRKIFVYGILFMLPMLPVLDFHPDLTAFKNPVHLANIIYLGLGASAFCFVSWNFAVKVLGAVKTSIYLYLVPVVTVITSVMVLKEPITKSLVIGTGLTLAGLGISQKKKSDSL